MKPDERPVPYTIHTKDPDRVRHTFDRAEAFREYNRLRREAEVAVFVGGMILAGDEWAWGERP